MESDTGILQQCEVLQKIIINTKDLGKVHRVFHWSLKAFIGEESNF